MTELDVLRRFAEEPDYEMPEPWLPGRRFIRPNFTLNLSPSPTNSYVSRVRTTEDGLDATIDEVRAILKEHGFIVCGWYVGPSCRPAGLAQLLMARGFTTLTSSTFEPHFTAMMMTSEPPAPSLDRGIEARLVQSFDEYVTTFAAGLSGLGETEDLVAKWIETADAAWSHEAGTAKMTHVAFADGAFAGIGLVTYGPSAILLAGSAVLPQYRGRGIYRALVASRWRAAAALGKPALAVHAGAMSKPILERCGFQEVCRVDVLMDPTLG